MPTRIKRLVSVIMVFAIFSAQLNVSAAITKTHWAYNWAKELVGAGVFESLDKLDVGKPMTTDAFYGALKKITGIRTTYEGQELTRLEAVKSILDMRGYGNLANYYKTQQLPFKDVETDQGYVYLAYKLGYISASQDLKFRPNDVLKTEEGIALLYRFYKNKNSKLDTLHGYYAIKSYDQVNLVNDLDAVSFGWGRIELDTSNQVVVNTSGTNNNEYRIPKGYELVWNDTSKKENRFLMLYVEEKYITVDGKKTRLAEYALMDKNREATVNAIVNTIDKYKLTMDFKGVLMDFEGLKGKTNAENYNAFLKLLKTELSKRQLKLVTAVHPPRRNNQEYFDGYDFKTIGDLSDFVVLMAHDYYPKRLTESEMKSGITLTPLTPYNEIFDALDLILDPKTGMKDRKKLLLQFSMDAIQWKVKDGKVTNAVPIRPSYSMIATLIEEGATVDYLKTLKSSRIVYEDKIDGSRNIIWYESEESIKAKMDLAKDFNIGGISVWRLGIIPQYDVINLWKIFKNR